MSPVNESAFNEEEEERDGGLESCGSLTYSRGSSAGNDWENEEEDHDSDIQNRASLIIAVDGSKSLPETIGTNETPSPVRQEFLEKKQDFEQLLASVTTMIFDYYDECGRPTETQLHGDFCTPQQISAKLKPIDQQSPGSNNDCLEDIRLVFQHSLKTMHPFFFDKLYFGTDPVGQIAELAVAVLNGNTHVYHVSPVFSVMEVETIQLMGQAFGLKKEDIDGTMNPGGSMSNRMALLLARDEHFSHVKRKGWRSEDKPVAFTAAQSHYSITTAAMVAGMGTENMIQVPAIRQTSQMDPAALESRIKQEMEKGNKPFFVNAVAGTTVMGAFDDLEAIGEICKRYKLWFHVDACWGGSLIFASPENKGNKFNGIENADSISFNPHKGLGVPQQCSMLITNKKTSALRQSNGPDAEYLFQPQNGDYDIGSKTLGCGRKADALKFWLTIRKNGLDGFRRIADNDLEKARKLAALVEEAKDFELVTNPMGTNVCYWYIPLYFQKNPQDFTSERRTMTHKIIFSRMKQRGRCLIQQQPLTEFALPNFFRLALGGDKTRLEDMSFLLDETRRLGQDISPIETDT